MKPPVLQNIKAKVLNFITIMIILILMKLGIYYSWRGDPIPANPELTEALAKATEVQTLMAQGKCPEGTLKKTTTLAGDPLPANEFRCEPKSMKCPEGTTVIYPLIPAPNTPDPAPPLEPVKPPQENPPPKIKKAQKAQKAQKGAAAKPAPSPPLPPPKPPPRPAFVQDTSRIERCAAYSEEVMRAMREATQARMPVERPPIVNAIDYILNIYLIIFGAVAAAVVGVLNYIMPWWMWLILLVLALPYLPLGAFWAFLALPLKTVRHYVTGMMAWDEFKARLRYAGRRLLGRPVSPEQGGGELGTASFCTPEQARALMAANRQAHKGAAALLGKVGGAPFGWFTDKHVLVLASTRSGKGVSLIIPNLLVWPGGVFVLDPKGENARATARCRAAFGQVAVLDPWNVSGLPAAGFNPLARLLLAGDSMPTEAAALAGALVVGEDDHWNNSARLLLRGLILHVLTAPEFDGKRDLVTVRRLLMSVAPADLFQAMQGNAAAGGLVSECGAAFATTPEKECGSILSTARQQTMILDDPLLRASLADRGAAGMDFGGWRRTGLSVFVCLPAPYMQTFNRWLRIVVTTALNTLTTRQDPPPLPVQFHLDELATLGRLEAVETAIGLAAGYGVQIWSVFQDLGQIRDLYKARAPSFWSNAGVRAVFSLQDKETAEYVSGLTGVTTIQSRTEQQTPYGQTTGQSAAPVARPLLRPEEVMQRYTANLMLVLLDGVPPLEAARVPYYQDPELAGLWEDPREPPSQAARAACLGG